MPISMFMETGIVTNKLYPFFFLSISFLRLSKINQTPIPYTFQYIQQFELVSVKPVPESVLLPPVCRHAANQQSSYMIHKLG